MTTWYHRVQALKQHISDHVVSVLPRNLVLGVHSLTRASKRMADLSSPTLGTATTLCPHILTYLVVTTRVNLTSVMSSTSDHRHHVTE